MVGFDASSSASIRWGCFATLRLSALMCGMKIAALSCLAQELKICAPYFLLRPHRKPINNRVFSPDFHLNPAFTLSMPEPFYFRHMTEFQNPKFQGLVQTCTFHPREGLPMLAALSQKCGPMTTHCFAVYSRKSTPRPTALGQYPGLMTGKSTLPWHHPFSLQAKDPQSSVSLLGSCLSLPPEHL